MATVLIVDDDKHTRALLERIFHNDERIARHGVKIVQAGDGIEGLKVFDRERPDIVITDLLMPRMDGFRFCRELRARAERRSVALLVLSGVYRDVSISAKLREEFGAGFYTKPYQIKDLVLALEKQLLRLAPDAIAQGSSKPDSTGDSPLPLAEPRRGKLEDTPLGRLLVDLYEDRATGILEVRRGRIEKRIDLVVGHPVAVSSNQRGEMLGHFLVLRGVITEKIHQEALERAHDEEKKLGEALMEMGMLTSADLVKHLTAQARYKITRALRWPDGSWSYRPNRDLLDTAAKGNALDPVAVVFLGLRKTATPEASTDAVAALEGRRVTLTPRGEKVRHTIERVFGTPFVEALQAMPPVEILLGVPFDAAQSMPALEALIVTGCVTGFGAPVRVEPTPPPEPDLEELSGSFLMPEPPTAQTGRPAALGPAPEPHAYDQIFADETSDVGAPTHEPVDPDAEVLDLLPAEAVPEELPLTDSAVYDVESIASGSPVITIDAEPAPEAEVLRERLLGEYLRLQGKDHYAVLDVARDATAAQIAAAYAERMAAFSLERYEPYDIGPDYGKLEEIHAAFRRAHDVLATPERRAPYDRELVRLGRAGDGAMMAAELAFRAGERRMQLEHYAGAVEHLRLAVDSAPDVADYQAALGWSLHRAGGEGAAHAAEHLAQALAIDPDHGAAHEFLGRVLIAEGRDARAAVEHLEKALDAQPPRLGALPPLGELRLSLGEPRHLEKRYRALLRRVRPGETELAVRLWRGLARTYLALGDPAAARTAYACAHRLAPDDAQDLDALADLAPTPRARFEHLRARWRLEPGSAKPGLALVAAAQGAGRFDAAYLAAAALAARGLGDAESEALHRRHRPRFLVRAMGQLHADGWAKVRHADDDAELGAIFAALEPAAQRHAPLTAADLGIIADDLLPEEQLPEAVARVRDYAAHVLGVPAVRVARRPDFGHEAHLGALAEPVLLVGPDILASTDRVALAFRLGRAMSFLPAGRAFAGSRPARVLKELFIAAVSLGGTPVAFEHPERVALAAQALATLPEEAQATVAHKAAAIAHARTSLNFSSYARALSRTADRVGLVLCGDPAVAAAAVAAMGVDPADLLDWAISGDHQDVRADLGLSVDV